jgi:hypothetical protein
MAVIEQEPETRVKRKLSYSTLRLARTCMRKFHMQVDMGVQLSSESTKLHLDRVWRRALEYRETMPAVDAIAKSLAHWEPTKNDLGYDREAIANILTLYFWRWEQMDPLIETIATNFRFEIPLRNPKTGASSRRFVLTGMIDKIIRFDNRLAIVKRKVTSDDLDVQGDYWKRMQIDSQISMYMRAARESGYDVKEAMYDVIRMPAQRPKLATPMESRNYKKDGTLYATQRDTDETPIEFGQRIYDTMSEDLLGDDEKRSERYFARRWVARTNDELTESAFDDWQTAQTIGDAANDNAYPRNDMNCLGFGRCAYFDLCTTGFVCNETQLPAKYRIADQPEEES